MPDSPTPKHDHAHPAPPIPELLTTPVARPTFPGQRDAVESAEAATGRRQRSKVLAVSGLGMEFVSTIGGGALLGYLADLALGTAPWGLLVLLIVGLVIATLRLVATALRLTK